MHCSTLLNSIPVVSLFLFLKNEFFMLYDWFYIKKNIYFNSGNFSHINIWGKKSNKTFFTLIVLNKSVFFFNSYKTFKIVYEIFPHKTWISFSTITIFSTWKLYYQNFMLRMISRENLLNCSLQWPYFMVNFEKRNERLMCHC